ncbi:MAG TPA: DUF1579 family protein [Pyrinomonadaceae bacterium]|nr:DUF1579 family protein [Pyrinomonadaceae bacterium]
MTRTVFPVGRYSIVCLGLLSLLGQTAAAPVAPDDVSARLVGAWAGEGKAFGGSSRPEMKWERTLNGKFIKLTYKAEFKSAKGAVQVFEGHAYYKSLGGGKYQGTWFDSQGSQHPITAVFESDALTANWGTPETELGKTIYRLTANDEMELIDSVRKKDGTWQEFHRAKLKRL